VIARRLDVSPFQKIAWIETETVSGPPSEFGPSATDSLNGDIVRAKGRFAGKRLFGLS
jgi:hypothetical protein